MFRFPPQPKWDLTIHPPSGPSILVGTHSFLQSMWNPHQTTPLQGPASLLAHRLVSTSLQGTASSLAYRPVSGSDTICNGPSPPLTDIFLFEFSLSGFPSRFKMRLLGRGFHTLIKGVSFSSPTDVGSHINRTIYLKTTLTMISTTNLPHLVNKM